MVGASLEQGINIIDVFMPQEQVRRDIGAALRGRRKDIILQTHFGSVVDSAQNGRSRDMDVCKKNFEGYYEAFGTDYMDMAMLFYVDSEEDFDKIFNSDMLTYLMRERDAGRIRTIGASSHNPVIAKKIVETNEVGVLMFSINPAFDMLPAAFDILHYFDGKTDVKSRLIQIEPARKELYEVCERLGVGVTVMKTYGAGRLLSAEHSPFGKALTAAQCIHYALTRPAVSSCLIGCKTPAEVEKAVEYIGMSDEQKDFSEIAAFQKGDVTGKCMYCNHCLPCPAGIDVAAVTKMLDIARLDEANVPDSVRSHYKSLTPNASDCIECGSCEGNCPFAVGVIENMRHAVKIFG